VQGLDLELGRCSVSLGLVVAKKAPEPRPGRPQPYSWSKQLTALIAPSKTIA
jgi:hypothetical protein